MTVLTAMEIIMTIMNIILQTALAAPMILITMIIIIIYEQSFLTDAS